ncbi:restriction endonuclease subunit S [Fibrobacter sp. UWH1]|uniref:restriction endonuclease subunit S n=1 Tax=Fibrobacter sp. UWH1 TaxID=1964354 RepID=UPI000B51FC90|nr:restriction endonuclease subunit S [Fibrobacter sp. UWH1]OWV16915.1 hypothetical protein B7992_01255 [Fibrobacter sp. UWH1]
MKQKWIVKRIEDICEKASSNIAQNKLEGITGDYPVFGASGFVQNADFYHRDSEYIGIVKDGSGVGRVNLYPAYSSLLGTMQYVLPKNGNDIRYIAYALKSLNLASFASGVAIPHIYFKDYGKCELPVPPKDEQERIVAELDLLNGVLEKQKAQLKELDTLAQSIFYDMFGDPIENSKGWEERKLGDVSRSITDGDHMPPPKSKSGIPFITISDVDKDSRSIDFSSTYYVPQEYYDKIKENRKAEVGDVLYTVTGSYGIPILVKENRIFCFQRHIALIKLGPDLVAQFLCYWALCASVKAEADKVATGIAQKTVGLNSIRNFSIILPPLSLQQVFADKIASIEKQKASINQSIAETQKLLDYTMDKYFG